MPVSMCNNCFSFLGFSTASLVVPSAFLQKWSKGKQKEKVNNAVLFDQPTTLSEVPKFKQITPSILSERLRVRY
jgi:hypothetical protein